MITLIILISLAIFGFLPMVGAYIGFMQGMYGEKSQWQLDNSDAYLMRDKK